ncbi:hypothetical protein DM860_015408 [Cuscuta australis]|uniref:Uncharacterized protein n=1 Tax=Cuscuta australis TaxID=267555 RepID=A0A328E7Y0_9ASTE|nr:hypothetical protein DM860_015408 [Cuscuta australis]
MGSDLTLRLAEWKKKGEAVGSLVHAKIKKDISCLVLSGMLESSDAEIKKAT